MSYLLNKFVCQVYDFDLHVTIQDYRTYLAGKDFGVSLITASKVCRAQVCQEKVFSALLISGLTWGGKSLSSSTEHFPEFFLKSNPAQYKICNILGVTICSMLGLWTQSQTRQVGIEKKEPMKHKKKDVPQSIDNWLSTLRCCIKLFDSQKEYFNHYLQGKRSRNEKNNTEKLKIIISKR